MVRQRRLGRVGGAGGQEGRRQGGVARGVGARVEAPRGAAAVGDQGGWWRGREGVGVDLRLVVDYGSEGVGMEPRRREDVCAALAL